VAHQAGDEAAQDDGQHQRHQLGDLGVQRPQPQERQPQRGGHIDEGPARRQQIGHADVPLGSGHQEAAGERVDERLAHQIDERQERQLELELRGQAQRQHRPDPQRLDVTELAVQEHHRLVHAPPQRGVLAPPQRPHVGQPDPQQRQDQVDEEDPHREGRGQRHPHQGRVGQEPAQLLPQAQIAPRVPQHGGADDDQPAAPPGEQRRRVAVLAGRAPDQPPLPARGIGRRLRGRRFLRRVHAHLRAPRTRTFTRKWRPMVSSKSTGLSLDIPLEIREDWCGRIVACPGGLGSTDRRVTCVCRRPSIR
jgi:hypothetical protein